MTSMSSDLEFYLEKPVYTLFGVASGPKQCRINIIGAPLEDTVSFRPGTRFAPDVLRYTSRFIEYSSSTGELLDLSAIADSGNAILVQGRTDINISRLRKIAETLLDLSSTLVVLGGEHTVTMPFATALTERGEVLLVIFDSHLDLREEWPPGQRISHATFLRRLIEEANNLKVLHIGSHALDKEELLFVEENQDKIIRIPLEDVHPGRISRLVRDLLREVDQVHLSIDVDVLHPAYMPAISNPEGTGLTYSELVRCVRTVLSSAGSKVKVVDIVEYNPMLDHGYTYAVIVLKLLIDIISTILCSSI